MSDESDRMLILLQDLAVIKEEARKKRTKPAAYRKRKNEIRTEMKQLAAEKKRKHKSS
jgi:hypothetical protein